MTVYSATVKYANSRASAIEEALASASGKAMRAGDWIQEDQFLYSSFQVDDGTWVATVTIEARSE